MRNYWALQASFEVGGTEEPIYVADVGENLLGFDHLPRSKAVLDFGEMTTEIGAKVVSQQESCGEAWECGVSVEAHKIHTAPLPKATHRCCLG